MRGTNGQHEKAYTPNAVVELLPHRQYFCGDHGVRSVEKAQRETFICALWPARFK